MSIHSARGPAGPPPPFLGLPHHYGYIVTDLEQAVADWHALTGAGPFLGVPHVRFDELTVCGEPAELDHTAAFAALGTGFVELQLIHAITPAARDAYGASASVSSLHHTAFAVEDADTASARLARAGYPRTITASGGGLDVVQHDAPLFNGARVEIHRNTEFFRTFFATVRSAAEHWDGREPLRWVGV